MGHFTLSLERSTEERLPCLTTSTCALALAAIAASTSFADVYNDGSFDQGPDNSNLDLISVEVTNDESNVFFSVTTRDFADWTKYMVFVDSIDDSGADGNNNGWVRNVDMGPAGIDYFMGAWVDWSGGTALYGWDDAWSAISGGSVVNIDGAANTVTMSISLAPSVSNLATRSDSKSARLVAAKATLQPT